MPEQELEVPKTFERLGLQQLQVYAKELQQHFQSERSLRRELEKQNQRLEQRIQEITALNHLFQQHLDERFQVAQAYHQLLEGLEKLSQDAATIVEQARSKPLTALTATDSLEPVDEPLSGTIDSSPGD